MVLDVIYIVVGLAVLIWSADKFIEGAVATAKYFAMPALMVGMLIVGFGTSVPEILISGFAAYNGSSGIALGNAYGSNIANIGLVLPITALLYPLVVSSRIVKREIPLLIVASIISFGFFYDHLLTQVEAAILLLVIVLSMILGLFYGDKKDSLVEELDQQDAFKEAHHISLQKALLQLSLSLVLLLFSSHYLVVGAVNIAKLLGISDLVIGLTVIAIGTSLPELASSITAAKRGEADIVLGNIIGSCLFNLLAVIGLAGVIQPVVIKPIFLIRDFSTMMGLTLLLWMMAFGIGKPSRIAKKKGALLLSVYIGYSLYLLLTLRS